MPAGATDGMSVRLPNEPGPFAVEGGWRMAGILAEERPKLVVCAGPPCSGKSTFAAALAEKFKLRWLQADRVLSILMPHSDRNEADRLVGYRAMLMTASELVQCSQSVVVDATFTTLASRELLRSYTQELRSHTHLIQIRISADVA